MTRTSFLWQRQLICLDQQVISLDAQSGGKNQHVPYTWQWWIPHTWRSYLSKSPSQTKDVWLTHDWRAMCRALKVNVRMPLAVRRLYFRCGDPSRGGEQFKLTGLWQELKRESGLENGGKLSDGDWLAGGVAITCQVLCLLAVLAQYFWVTLTNNISIHMFS